MTARASHTPVLLDEVIDSLQLQPGDTVVDGTFGAGGYTRAMLAVGAGRVIGFDRDPDAIAEGRSLVPDPRLTLVEERFSQMDRVLAERGIGPVDAIALDIGVSSMQLDRAERGFSFRLDGPLDMRMGTTGESAADLVARLSEAELAELIRSLGEERYARRVARAIVAARSEQPIRRTGELADLVRGAIPHREPGLDSATRTFQALRIAVNDELGELDRGLIGAERLLMPGGRLAVVAFHSLEDARVKDFMRRRSTAAAVSRHAPPPPGAPAPSFRLLHRRTARPGAEEASRNPRARSARLRAAERTAAPPWPAAGSETARRIAAGTLR